MVSYFTFFPEFQADKVEPETAPRVAVGAASPLWLMFGGAAAAGAAYWWWASRWREAVNLEAMMALAPEPVAQMAEAEAVVDAPVAPVIEEVLEPVVEAVAAAADATETLMDATEAATEDTVEATVEVVLAANEDLAEIVAGPAVDVAPTDIAPADVTSVEIAPVEAAPATGPAAEAVDDLTRLVGVGPKLAASLVELGVTRFSQIAAWTPDELASFDQLLNLKGRAERDAWIAQAKRFAAPTEA